MWERGERIHQAGAELIGGIDWTVRNFRMAGWPYGIELV